MSFESRQCFCPKSKQKNTFCKCNKTNQSPVETTSSLIAKGINSSIENKKRKEKKKKEERLMLSHYTPPENATNAMLRDARRDGLSGLVSNGQAVNVTHYFYRWRRRRSKFHSLRWNHGLVGNCCIQPLPFANTK